IRDSFACIGFGPGGTFIQDQIGGAQQSQANFEYGDGVYSQVPLKGIFFWNSHAFNLTDVDTNMHARINFYYADEQLYPSKRIFDFFAIFWPIAAPYTTQTVCSTHQLQRGTRLFSLSSHTHKRGKHFTIEGPGG